MAATGAGAQLSARPTPDGNQLPPVPIMPASRTPALATIGYEGTTVPDFLRTLQEAKVELLVDVLRTAGHRVEGDVGDRVRRQGTPCHSRPRDQRNGDRRPAGR